MGNRSTSAENTWEYEAIESQRKLGGNSLSYNCFFMCTLSSKHGGVRMLFTCEEKEISYPGYFYWGGRKDSHDWSWLSEMASPREVGHQSVALLRTKPFYEGLHTTLAHESMHESDGFAKQELGQVTSWLIHIC